MAPPPAPFKKVLIKITSISKISNPDKLARVTIDINAALLAASSLYTTPAVPFAALNGAADVVTAAKTAYDNGRTKARKNAITAAMNVLKDLHRTQADYVVDIANQSTNAANRQAAYDNILLSGYTPYKLQPTKKGAPSKPVVSAKNVDEGVIELAISDVNYSATRTTFILSEFGDGISAKNGQVLIPIGETKGIEPKPLVCTRTANGKKVTFSSLNSGRKYYYAAFGENAKGVFGFLSEVLSIICT